MQPTDIQIDDTERGTIPATFSTWLMEIVKGSFGTLSVKQLKPYEKALKTLFEEITFVKDDSRYFSSKYDRQMVASRVRKAFCDRRSFATTEELIPQESSLLKIENFTSVVTTATPEDYYPKQDMVERIVQDDMGKLKPKADDQKMMKLAEESGDIGILELLKKRNSSHPQKIVRSIIFRIIRTVILNSIFWNKCWQCPSWSGWTWKYTTMETVR